MSVPNYKGIPDELFKKLAAVPHLEHALATPSGSAETSVNPTLAKEKEVPMYDLMDGTRETNSAGERTFEAASGEQTRELSLSEWKEIVETPAEEQYELTAEPLAKAVEFDARTEATAIVRLVQAGRCESEEKAIHLVEIRLLAAAGRAASGRHDAEILWEAQILHQELDKLGISRGTTGSDGGDIYSLWGRVEKLIAAPAPAQLSEEEVRDCWVWACRQAKDMPQTFKKMTEKLNALLRSQPAGTEEK